MYTHLLRYEALLSIEDVCEVVGTVRIRMGDS